MKSALRLSRQLSTIAHHASLPITYHPEVLDALHSGKAVVALETAIVTHGMPEPINLKTAQSVESIVRSTGAIPATIGLIKGRLHLGLDTAQLEYLASRTATRPEPLIKLSRRDLAPAIANKRDGGTTIAATMILAQLAGIKVFATGGLGGVHRNGENSMDVSADLTELGRTPVAVVSAGVKSILDIGRTLEYLETQGVTVSTYGSTEFPAFFSPKSGFKSPWTFNTPQVAAQSLYTAHQIGLQSGTLIACPIPAQYEAAGLEIQAAVDQAVRESEENGVSKQGKDATPWLLNRVTELTGGASIENNIALIENTANIGGQIAVEYAKLQGTSPTNDHQGPSGVSSLPKNYFASDISHLNNPSQVTESPQLPLLGNSGFASTSPSQSTPIAPAAPSLVVAGATAVDITAHASPTSTSSETSLMAHSTVPGKVSISLGGVARNMAEAAHRLLPQPLSSPHLISPLGQDGFGTLVQTQMSAYGMRTDGLLQQDDLKRSTPVCNMLLTDGGDLVGGVADFSALDRFEGKEVISELERIRALPGGMEAMKLVALDGNMRPDVLSGIVQWCAEQSVPTWFEPTSISKSVSILPAVLARYQSSDQQAFDAPITYCSPNILELEHIFQQARLSSIPGGDPLTSHPRWFATIDSFELDSNFHGDMAKMARSGGGGIGDRGAEWLVERGVLQMVIQMLPIFSHLVVKCGDKGVLVGMHILPSKTDPTPSSAWTTRTSSGTTLLPYTLIHKTTLGALVVLKYFPAISIDPTEMVNVTGAGDTLVGSMLASLVSSGKSNILHHPKGLDATVSRAQKAAGLTLRSEWAVSPKLSSLLVTA